MRIYTLSFLLFWFSTITCAQTITGSITSNNEPVPFASVIVVETGQGTASDEQGNFSIILKNDTPVTLKISAIGYKTILKKRSTAESDLLIVLESQYDTLEETVVTGTLKSVLRSESPVPVEVYTPKFLQQNPTATLFEAMQNVNGVRPQINCNVCNTGDIHINGLEGPYTLVLIDGMPLVSGLGSVYGLQGIPNALIEQVEIIKGPASSLYGSEAVGGLINVITKSAAFSPLLFAESMTNSYGETNLDLGTKFTLGKKATALVGGNFFWYDTPVDNNDDNFTDVTLQKRASLFQKWNFNRKEDRILEVAGRLFFEERWGGEMQWTKANRGGDDVYGESIYTRRWEVTTKYQLPLEERILFTGSFNQHHQNSAYGTILYTADQHIGFGQLTWEPTWENQNALFGTALRYNYYSDNTPATLTSDYTTISSIFAQNEFKLNNSNQILLGARWDYNSRHGSIFTPRLAYRLKLGDNSLFRLNTGTGFRVVNLFTEDHAAISGAREVVITEALRPEKSININANVVQKWYLNNGTFIRADINAFYTHFSNAILPDYDTNPNQIIYDNLDGKSVSKGISATIDANFPFGLNASIGATLMDVSSTENNSTKRQPLTEQFSATWNLGYTINQWSSSIDYTGNVYGPMVLPLAGALDPRQPKSPFWSIQNIQYTYKGIKNVSVFGGVKNVLNWTPNKGNPFIIARANDPFDKAVTFDSSGTAIATPNNPYALTFDPTYVYGPNQGRRLFLGIRYQLF